MNLPTKRLLLSALLAAALISGATTAQAQAVAVAGTASIQVEGGVFSNEPTKRDMQRAIDAARLSLWKNFAARSFSEARSRQMLGRDVEIEQRLGGFLSASTSCPTTTSSATAAAPSRPRYATSLSPPTR